MVLYKKLNEDYPDTAEVALELKQDIEGFMEFLPLIKCLLNEALEADHWKELEEIVNLPDFHKDENLKLEYIIQNNVNQHFEAIDEITNRA